MKKAHIYAIPAIGAALIAVLAQISIPIGPVPFTLQNFAIGLIATVFRPREAVLSVGLYLLLGAIGIPVFASGGAGFHVLVGPSAGYLWFDLVYAGLTSYLIHKKSGYIRAPFLLEGAWIGLLGAVVPSALVFYVYNVVYTSMNNNLADQNLYLYSPNLLVPIMVGALFGLGILIGAIGSSISMRRFLKI